LSSGTEALRIPLPAPAVSRDFAPDDGLVAVADLTDTTRLYDAATGRPKGELRLDGVQFGALTISPDGRTLASLQSRRNRNAPGYHLGFWDLRTRQLRGQIPENTFVMPGGFRFSPDGQTIVTGTPSTE